MTSAMKNGHECGTWNVGGACVLQGHPKYSHKRISSAAKAKFSGITAGRMRLGVAVNQYGHFLTQQLRSVRSCISPDLHKFELAVHMINSTYVYRVIQEEYAIRRSYRKS